MGRWIPLRLGVPDLPVEQGVSLEIGESREDGLVLS